MWPPELLEDLCDALAEVTGEGAEFQWNNQQLVHLAVPGQRAPWATVLTKRPESIELALRGPKSLFGLGRISDLGHEPALDGQDDTYDVMRTHFRHHEDLDRDRLNEFLVEHLEGVRSAFADS